MDDMSKLVVICFVMTAFVLGFITGYNPPAISGSSSEKEIIELNIELTKLRIKELKEANNG